MLGFFLLFSLTIMAQVDRRNDIRSKTEMEGEEKSRQKEYEKERGKSIENSINSLKEELSLDELQFVAIRQIILESARTEGIIMKKEDSDENKMKALTALSDTTDAKVRALLNPDQIEKLETYRLNPNKKKKNKKK